MVAYNGRLVKVIRNGYDMYENETRVRSPGEDPTKRETGEWVPRRLLKVLPFGTRLVSHSRFMAADQAKTMIDEGSFMSYCSVDDDGDIYIEYAGRRIPLFWEDCEHLRVVD